MASISLFSRCALVAIVSMVLCSGFTASAEAQTINQKPGASGELRVAIVMSNAAIAVRNPQGEISGLTADFGKWLAGEMGVNLKLVPYDNIVRFNQSLSRDDWDVAFVSRDLSRTGQLAFGDVLFEVDNVYVARPGLSVRTPDEVDRAGTKVAVSHGSPLDGPLSRALSRAQVLRIPVGQTEAREALAYRRADVVAEAAPVAYRIVNDLPGATVVVARLNATRIVMTVPKKDATALDTLNDLVRKAKRDGVLADMIKTANLRGVRSPR